GAGDDGETPNAAMQAQSMVLFPHSPGEPDDQEVPRDEKKELKRVEPSPVDDRRRQVFGGARPGVPRQDDARPLTGSLIPLRAILRASGFGAISKAASRVIMSASTRSLSALVKSCIPSASETLIKSTSRASFPSETALRTAGLKSSTSLMG